jgi:hypothetical protein
MLDASRDFHDALAMHRVNRQWRGGAAVDEVAQSELAERAVSPCKHIAVCRKRCRVLLATSNVDHVLVVERLDLRGHRLALEVGVAELTLTAVAPRIHLASVGQGEGVPRPARTLFNVLISQGLDELGGLVRHVIAVAEAAIVTAAKRVELPWLPLATA